jgi:hypothetical protein
MGASLPRACAITTDRVRADGTPPPYPSSNALRCRRRINSRRNSTSLPNAQRVLPHHSLDHILVLGEEHLVDVLAEYCAFRRE